MKYLERWMKFESKNDYYEEITWSEFSSGGRYNIPNKFRNIIKYSINSGYEINADDSLRSYLFIYNLDRSWGNKKCSWVIRYGSDDWWYVDKDNSLLYDDGNEHCYYKCDQFEGLLFLLSESGVIIKNP